MAPSGRGAGGKKRKKTVMAFGAFDGVHAGHIYYLKQAKKKGDYLVVAVARDDALWKFAKRYSLPENERAETIKSLGLADRVVFGSKTNAIERIMQVRPDVIAISAYHPVDKRILEMELHTYGLKTKVVAIQTYKPKVYNRYFGVKPDDLMGLPRKRK